MNQNSLTTYLEGYTRTWDTARGHWVVDTPVARLLSHLEAAVQARGLTLSRWQSSKAKWIVRITYAIHYGARPVQSRHLYPEAIVASVVLYNREGKTEKCEAYRGFTQLLQELEDYHVNYLP